MPPVSLHRTARAGAVALGLAAVAALAGPAAAGASDCDLEAAGSNGGVYYAVTLIAGNDWSDGSAAWPGARSTAFYRPIISRAERLRVRALQAARRVKAMQPSPPTRDAFSGLVSNGARYKSLMLRGLAYYATGGLEYSRAAVAGWRARGRVRKAKLAESRRHWSRGNANLRRVRSGTGRSSDIYEQLNSSLLATGTCP